MGTWVTCPNCVKDLPRKYNSKRERKELHVPTCKACSNRNARKAYEVGVKRGIWLKKWKRAGDAFSKAATAFSTAGQTDSRLTSELMSYMSQLEADKTKKTAKYVFEKIISGYYDKFLNKDFVIPEFLPFDPLYYEAMGWKKFFDIQDKNKIVEKIDHMKETSRVFFKMGYQQLYFSKYLLNEKKTNVDLALNIEAESEEYLGGLYASKNDIDNASIHLINAVSAYTSLENLKKAKELKMVRKDMRMETACWVCGSRIRWHRRRFNYKFTYLPENQYENVMEQLRQRQERNPTMYDDTLYSTKMPIESVQEHEVKENQGERGLYLSTCKTCQGVIDKIAKDVVDRELIPVWSAIQMLQTDVQYLKTQIAMIQAQMKRFRIHP